MPFFRGYTQDEAGHPWTWRDEVAVAAVWLVLVGGIIGIAWGLTRVL